MIERLRLREVIGAQRGGEHEQQAAVVVVGGEDVRLRRFRPVPFRVHDHRLVQHPNAPLQSSADVIVAGLELEPEHLVHGTADHVQVAEPGELAGAAAGADQATLLIAQEEGGVRRRVIVVEQLEEEAEPAFLAAASAAREARCPVGRDAAIAAARADEVRHQE